MQALLHLGGNGDAAVNSAATLPLVLSVLLLLVVLIRPIRGAVTEPAR